MSRFGWLRDPWYRVAAGVIAGLALLGAMSLRPSRTVIRRVAEAEAETETEVRQPRASALLSTSTPIAAPTCYVGVVAAPRSVVVTVEAPGRVERLFVRIGERVERGQMLAVLESAEAKDRMAIAAAELSVARAELRRAELSAERAEHDHRRKRALADLLPAAEIEAARFDWGAARLATEVAAAGVERSAVRLEVQQRELARTQVRAPIAGSVAALHGAEGEVLARGGEILRIVASGPLVARFAVPPEHAESLTPGSPMRVEIETPRRVFRTAVQDIGPEVDAAARMIFIEAPLDGPDGTLETLAVGAVARVSSQLEAAECVRASVHDVSSPPPGRSGKGTGTN